MQHEKAAAEGLLAKSPFRGTIKCLRRGIWRKPLVRSMRKRKWGVKTCCFWPLVCLRQCSILGIKI